jgi:hypothetical protein
LLTRAQTLETVGIPTKIVDEQRTRQLIAAQSASNGITMKTKTALAALTMLAACTTISDVTPAGDGRYTVTTQVRGGMTAWGEVKASSLQRADAYCRQQGKLMHQVDMQTHGVRGWTPQEAELTFSCTTS